MNGGRQLHALLATSAAHKRHAGLGVPVAVRIDGDASDVLALSQLVVGGQAFHTAGLEEAFALGETERFHVQLPKLAYNSILVRQASLLYYPAKQSPTFAVISPKAPDSTVGPACTRTGRVLVAEVIFSSPYPCRQTLNTRSSVLSD